jgi:hypothetical protein
MWCWNFSIVLITYLCVGGAAAVCLQSPIATTVCGDFFMPGLRSAYTVPFVAASSAQRRRLERDEWYRSAHSRPDRQFVEVPRRLASSIKQMAAARLLHDVRDTAAGTVSHFGRCASQAAMKAGFISSQDVAADSKIFAAGNAAKHSNRFIGALKVLPRSSWADQADSDGDCDQIDVPTDSGAVCYNECRDDVEASSEVLADVFIPTASGSRMLSDLACAVSCDCPTSSGKPADMDALNEKISLLSAEVADWRMWWANVCLPSFTWTSEDSWPLVLGDDFKTAATDRFDVIEAQMEAISRKVVDFGLIRNDIDKLTMALPAAVEAALKDPETTLNTNFQTQLDQSHRALAELESRLSPVVLRRHPVNPNSDDLNDQQHFDDQLKPPLDFNNHQLQHFDDPLKQHLDFNNHQQQHFDDQLAVLVEAAVLDTKACMQKVFDEDARRYDSLIGKLEERLDALSSSRSSVSASAPAACSPASCSPPSSPSSLVPLSSLTASASCPTSAFPEPTTSALEGGPPLASLCGGGLVQHVRLGGLRSASLNDRPGLVLGQAPKPGNWKVLILNECEPKSVPETNLFQYIPSDHDLCAKCNENFNFASVPACGCDVLLGMTASSPTSWSPTSSRPRDRRTRPSRSERPAACAAPIIWT